MRRFLFLAGLILGAFAIFTLAVQVVIGLQTKPYIYKNLSQVPQAQAVIIPGAAVLLNRTLSPIFRDRVDTAILLYNSGKVAKILVSGSNSTIEQNEVNPVRNYLLAQGIPSEDIFLDHAGFDTYSTMYRAKAIFQVQSAIIATQSFHLPRSIFLARNLDITAYGLPANQASDIVLLRNYVREFFAHEKAALDLLLRRKPKYLGEPIPITGTGRDYE